MENKHRRSLEIALIGVFGALHAVLTMIPGIWRSWMILIDPIEGILLGSKAGFVAALIGSIFGRAFRLRSFLGFIFGLAEPVGAMVAGLIFRGRWRIVMLIYGSMLGAYFLHPLGRILPVWCLWDIYIAFGTIPLSPLVIRLLKKRRNLKGLTPSLILASFIGIEADVLMRIFLFIPMEFYKLMGITEAVSYTHLTLPTTERV